MGKIFKHILRILNLLAAAALLFSYLAPFVNPATWIMPALFGLAYPYLLILNLLFILFWLMRLKKEIIISLVVVLLGWAHLNNLLPLNGKYREVPAEAEQSRVFRVLTYNVRTFSFYKQKENEDTMKGLFEFIREQDPQIVCLQEFYCQWKKGRREEDILAQLPSCPHKAIYYTRDPVNKKGPAVATLSSFPIVKRSRIPFGRSNNAAIYSDLLVGGDTLRVFNIHLQSISFGEDNYAFMDTVKLTYNNEQMAQIRKIGSMLKHAFIQRAEQADLIANYIKDSPYPVLVMGDFNDTPQSYAYRRINKGMKDAFRRSGRGFGNTYAGELPSFRIDHVMMKAPLESYAFKRIKAGHSDHFPVTGLVHYPESIIAE